MDRRMVRKQSGSKNTGRKRLAIGLLLLLALGFSVDAVVSARRSRTQAIAAGGFVLEPAPEIPKKIDQKIDMGLKRGNHDAQLNRLKVQVENDGSGLPLDHRRLETENLLPDPTYNLGVAIEQENHADQVYRDLARIQRRDPDSGLTPEQKINARLAHRQWMKDYNESYTKAFAKEFVRRAAEDGWQVELDKNLEVIAVRPLDRPQPLRFPQSVDARQGGGGTAQ